MMLLPLVFFAAAAASARALPPANTPIGISVSISRYADPLLRRPLDPNIVPLKCEALIFSANDTTHRAIIGNAMVTLAAGEKQSTKPSVLPNRTELTCDVAPDGHSAKTLVTFYRQGTVAAQQTTDIWLPEVKKSR
jgi:hypothetical protein